MGGGSVVAVVVCGALACGVEAAILKAGAVADTDGCVGAAVVELATGAGVAAA